MAEQDRKMDRKAVFEPYDMDTGIGTNNSGVLMFSPYLEDTDRVSSVISGGDSGGSEAPVYNAQDSVLWNNIRDAFGAELMAMYRNLRANGAWNYDEIERRFEDHQAIWPEAIFNEDAWVKYIVPLVDPVTVDEDTGKLIRTDRYLTMLQGSKEEQRKWWLYNRFRYLDSKYDTGNATANTINIRFFNEGTLRIKAAIPLYIAVSFGGGTTPMLKRTDVGETAEFPYIAPTGVTEMETWIHSANLITDVGDLSQFYPNECDFSKAVLLKRLKIGDATEGYSNANLVTLDVRNCQLLEYIDCRNCPRLGITINLENSPRLAEAYFDGTIVTGVDLADGCVIETLHLPETVTALTLLNLKKLRDFQMPSYANVSRLMLSNIDTTVVDPVEILKEIPANSQINIQGLYLDLPDADAVAEFFDLLSTMTGVTRERSATTGEWMYHEEEKPVVGGEVHTTLLTGAQIAAFNEISPYVKITADHVISQLNYYTYDGSELLYTETVYDGGDGTWTGAPTRPSDERYNYTFGGWSRVPNGTIAADATKNILADRNVYAAYTVDGVTYTVKFYNERTLLYNATKVLYGGTAEYVGETPVHPTEPEDYEFYGWSPSNEDIRGNTNCYATWRYIGSDIARKFIERTFAGIYANSTQTEIGPQAFMNMSLLTEVEFPAVTAVGVNAFRTCSRLTRISFPEVITIGAAAFAGTSMKSISFPKLKTIGSNAFATVYSLRTVFIPEVTDVGSWAFTIDNDLQSIEIPKCTTISAGAFCSCSALTYASLPMVSRLANNAFAHCVNLSTVVLGTSISTVCPLEHSIAFQNVPNVSIYVPDDLVSDYKAATNWTYYSSRIFGISELNE